MIDTATVYKNEKDIGRALRDSGIDRRKIFITTKLGPADHGYFFFVFYFFDCFIKIFFLSFSFR
jgi:hypothetical protein